MEELGEKLSQLFSDKESLDKLKSLAGALLGGGSPAESFPAPAEPPCDRAEPPPYLPEPPASAAGSGELLARLLPLLGRFQAGGDREKIRLLEALRPFVGEERQKKVDQAILLLKLLEIAPEAIRLFKEV